MPSYCPLIEVSDIYIYRDTNTEPTAVRKILKIYRALVTGILDEDEVIQAQGFLLKIT